MSNTRFLFCHGCPGGPDDARIGFPSIAQLEAPSLLATDDPKHSAQRALDDMIRQRPGKVSLVGFSLGAMVAIKLARQNPEKIEKLYLVSPAAPLQAGDFLPNMAGRIVFRVARGFPQLLPALIAVQRLLLRVSPDGLLTQLFSSACHSERELLNDEDFKAVLVAGLNNSLDAHRHGYAAVLKAYVADWQTDLQDLAMPIEIWHGGSDSWAPPEMATALKAAFGDCADLMLLDDKGHYATLAAFRAALSEQQIADQGDDTAQ